MQEEAIETNRAIQNALAAFRAAMSEATNDQLWRLHAALEKDTMLVVRGGWGRIDRRGRPGERFAGCPLTILFFGEPRERGDLETASRLSEALLREHGFTAADFYGAWDAGLIPVRRLLRLVDAETTRRALSARSDPPPGR